MFPHALQEAVPQFTALWPERFIHGDALNDDFSVMVRLRSLLLHFFCPFALSASSDQPSFTNRNPEGHFGIQFLKKFQKNLKSVFQIGAADSYL